jgi:5-methylcytosine-specific restriction endonuclease McrA
VSAQPADRHGQEGIVPRSARATERESPERLYVRVLAAMREARQADPAVTLEGLAAAATTALMFSPRRRLRALLLAHLGDRPHCSLCGLRIFLDEPQHHPASFSIDHVLRRADGGRWEMENARPAHKLCNEARAVFEVGRKVKPRLRQRLDALRAHVEERLLVEVGEG